MTVLHDKNHILVLDEDLWSASRGEWHETKNKTGEGSYWIDLSFDDRSTRLEYSSEEERDATWEEVCAFFAEEFGE